MSDNFEDRLRTGLHDLADGAPPPTIPAGVAGRPKIGPRTLALASIAAAIVLVAAALVFLPGRGHPRQIAVLAPTTTTNAADTVPTSPDTSLPQTTPATEAPTTPPTTAPAATSTSAVAATTPTSVPRTTVAPTTTTVPKTCVNLPATTASDKGVYIPGATVTITVTVRNSGAQACRIYGPYPPILTNTIEITSKATGAVVWAPVNFIQGSEPPPKPLDLVPGASYVWTTVQWDQHPCASPCNQNTVPEGPALVPGGDYTAQPTSGPAPPGPATPVTFTIQ
ncbi:MAG TPA: hypothetical protein VHT75_16370 [Acidimicrobiales bacterium]|jgi:hypothetical protein|nr:hypothetical protein [Acidimicrobiales bacterium]